MLYAPVKSFTDLTATTFVTKKVFFSRTEKAHTKTQKATQKATQKQHISKTVCRFDPLGSVSAKNDAICTGQKFHRSHGDYSHEQNSLKKHNFATNKTQKRQVAK